jgi:hypothetical protein
MRYQGIETATSGALLREEMLISMVIMDISTTENMQAVVDHITIGIDDIMDQKLPLRQVGQKDKQQEKMQLHHQLKGFNRYWD